MKIRLPTAAILVSLVLLIAGCGGISQQQFDTAVADFTKTQQELTTARAELEKSRKDLETVQTDLKSAQAKVTELTSSLDKSNAQVASVKADLKSSFVPLNALLGVNQGVLGVLAAAILNQRDVMPTRITTLSGRVAAFDPELKAIWEEAHSTNATGGVILKGVAFERLMNLVAERMNFRAGELRQKLP